jgi:hypothetical protein
MRRTNAKNRNVNETMRHGYNEAVEAGVDVEAVTGSGKVAGRWETGSLLLLLMEVCVFAKCLLGKHGTIVASGLGRLGCCLGITQTTLSVGAASSLK